ncbi:MAG: PTS sugar transporter subunit IIB [Erysipelotrichaceae bacterium]|nr:PTS sugar transporter subunit IIB [Erysipelotrichaceae bacterium]
MATTKILLCCGGGISSGMLAQACRKAAKKKGLDVKIDAKSESQVNDYLSQIDVLMLAPHYEVELPKFQKLAEPHGFKVAVIAKDVYGMLDGERLIEAATDLLK